VVVLVATAGTPTARAETSNLANRAYPLACAKLLKRLAEDLGDVDHHPKVRVMPERAQRMQALLGLMNALGCDADVMAQGIGKALGDTGVVVPNPDDDSGLQPSRLHTPRQ
jgi:hypothetical protein